MPITGWWCAKCRARVPLDHYDVCPGVHPDFAAAVLADNQKHRTEGIHVTQALGCPRRGLLEKAEDVHVDPLAYNAMLGGTAWHKLMETASTKPELCEVDVAGVVNGVKVVGTIDRLHPPTAISDWKTTGDWAEKWLKKPKAEGGGMKLDHLAQMSLYAELVQQTQGWRPSFGIVWYRMQKEMLYFAEELWGLNQVLDYKPLGGDYTVAELLEQCQSTDWKALPLVGESMRFGTKTACDYCAVREHCWSQAKGAPF